MTLRVCLVSAVLLLLLIVAARNRPVEAVAGGGCMPGSYLAVEGSGTQSLWTFSSDGTFHAASSAQSAFTFSQIHGTWEREGAQSAHVVGLDFGFRQSPVGAGVPPQSVTRIDGAVQFTRDCQQFAGAFDLRFYGANEDPLNPTTVDPAGSDSFTARRIQVR